MKNEKKIDRSKHVDSKKVQNEFLKKLKVKGVDEKLAKIAGMQHDAAHPVHDHDDNVK